MKLKLRNSIAAVREDRQISQKLLADAVGVRLNQLQKFESGEFIPDMLIGFLIADVLDVDVSDIFYLEKD